MSCCFQCHVENRAWLQFKYAVFVQFNLKCSEACPSLFISTAFCEFAKWVGCFWNRDIINNMRKPLFIYIYKYLSAKLYVLAIVSNLITVRKFVCVTIKCSEGKQIKYYRKKYLQDGKQIKFDNSVISTKTFLYGFLFRNWKTMLQYHVFLLSFFVFVSFFSLKRHALFYILCLGFTKRDQNTNQLCGHHLIIEFCGWQISLTFDSSGYTLVWFSTTAKQYL